MENISFTRFITPPVAIPLVAVAIVVARMIHVGF
jgi:hypothetical protein